MRVAGGDAAGLAVERGREEQRLAVARRGGHDAVDDRAEAHVEHAVGLVEDEDPDAREGHVAAADEVLEAAGRGDEDVRLAGGARLLLDAGAAVDGRDGERAGVGQRADLLDDLQGELAGGGEDEAGLLGAVGLQAVDHRRAEGEGLARAGRGVDEDVAAREHVGDGEGLDGER